MRRRLSARGRLTLLYTALVLGAGVAMTALTYLLMRRGLRGVLLVHHRPPGATRRPAPLADAAGGAGAVDAARDATLAELLSRSTLALAVVTLLAAALGWLMAGRVLRPIRAIAATARRLSAENLSERVPVRAPADELAALAGTINGMLDRIQRGIAERDRVLASQRMFTANAAHELRTPLATMRAAIDVTLDGEPGRAELIAMAGDIATAIEHSRRTLDGLLALARSEAGPGPRAAGADLATIAEGVTAGAAAGASARGIALRTRLRAAPVGGEPVLLERMVSNLVDNAVRYNRAGGHLAVTTGTTSGTGGTGGSWAFLRVVNDGPVIAAGTAHELLEPFVRADPGAEDGAGLGLSIVRAVVAAHHGELQTTARPTGGMDITVLLPRPWPPGGTGHHDRSPGADGHARRPPRPRRRPLRR